MTAETQAGDEPLRPFFYDVAELPGYTITELLGDGEEVKHFIDTFGRDLVTKAIVRVPGLSVFHEEAKPGERVKPHRHGTNQVTFMLRGELIYGNRRTTAGQGFFSPDTLYSWRAGDEGAEWIEIHGGDPGIFLDRPE